MAGQDLTHPNNTILISGSPAIREYEIGANATAAKMIPGCIVILDTIAGNIKEGGDKADGVLGVLMEKPNGLLTDYYARGEQARVIVGGDCDVLVTMKTNGGSATEGTPICCAANGQAEIKAVGALGAQGDTVGIGAEILANDGAKDNLYAIHLKIVPDQLATS